MSTMGFGTTIPVLSLNLGFPGTPSRGFRQTVARQVLASTPNPIKFGDAVTLIPDSTGGKWQSIADFIAGGGTFAAKLFAGIAQRNVKTNLSYSTLGNVGAPSFGQFAPGSMGEAMEQGSITVVCNNGQPVASNAIYIRVALDAAIPAGVVGGVEAVADPNPVTTNLTTTNGSASATVASATGITVGMIVTNADVPAGTSVLAIVGTTVTLSANATGGATATATFNHLVQVPGVEFRTGVIDENLVAEITMLNRVAA